MHAIGQHAKTTREKARPVRPIVLSNKLKLSSPFHHELEHKLHDGGNREPATNSKCTKLASMSRAMPDFTFKGVWRLICKCMYFGSGLGAGDSRCFRSGCGRPNRCTDSLARPWRVGASGKIRRPARPHTKIYVFMLCPALDTVLAIFLCCLVCPEFAFYAPDAR